MTVERMLDLIRETLKATEFCFLITLSEAGPAQARLMQPFEPEPDLTIWFGASPRSRKVQEIQTDNRVTLGCAQAETGAYVTLIGTASIESDLAQRQRYWREAFAAFWPDGPAGDDYVLIKFVPTQIELMHIGQQVAPEPFGLRPVKLVRAEGRWGVADGADSS